MCPPASLSDTQHSRHDGFTSRLCFPALPAEETVEALPYRMKVTLVFVSGCCHVATPLVIQVCYEPTTTRRTPFLSSLRVKRMSLKLAPGREIQEPDDGGLFSDQLQHPDWPPLGEKTQVSALNANQAGPSRPFVRTYHSNNQPTVAGNLHHSAFFWGKSCRFPQ